MKTVLYFDWIRNKKKYIKNILTPVLVLAVLFILSVLLDLLVPAFNYTYMRWPDMIKDLLGLPAWNAKLYGNIWQIVALFYPFYYIYTAMSGLAGAVVEEERLETVVYLKNLSIERSTILLAKGCMWIALSFVNCLALLIENALFFLLLRAGQMEITMLKYYMSLFLIGILYMGIAVFVASYSQREKNCEDKIFGILLIPFLLARIYAVVGFFADLLAATGREGAVTDTIGIVADKLNMLTLISPITWCWPAARISWIYVICGVAVAVVMTIAGYSIYTREGVIYRN